MRIFPTAYIDPGTGSMLFTVVIGVAGALWYFLKDQFIKLKSVFTGGKAVVQDREKIPFLIFSDSKRYYNVFGPLCEECEKRGIEVQYWTMSEDDPVFSASFLHVHPEYIGNGSAAFARLNRMKAGLCLSTTPGLDVLQWKRSKDTDCYIHIFHDVTEGTGYRMFGMDYYDEVLLTGEFQAAYIRKMEEMRGLPQKKLTVTGSPYMDALAARLARETAEEAGAEAGSREGGAARPPVPTILLAPSWGASSILNKYGEAFLSALADTGYRIVVRPHPQSATSDPELLARLRSRFPESERFSWNFDNDNFEALKNADLMITDFSGVMFDYALVFDRALLYADVQMDTAPYDAAWFEEENWRLRILPELGKKLDPADFGRMKDLIDEVLSDDRYAEGRRRLREICWQKRGRSACETVDYLETVLAKQAAAKADAAAEQNAAAEKEADAEVSETAAGDGGKGAAPREDRKEAAK